MGARRRRRRVPPTTASPSQARRTWPASGSQCARFSPLTHISQTRARGAAKMRSISSGATASAAAGEWRPSVPASIVISLLDFRKILVQAVKALLPETPVSLYPSPHLFERACLELARPPLRRAAAGDEPRLLQHLEVLRDRRQAHIEWFGKLID